MIRSIVQENKKKLYIFIPLCLYLLAVSNIEKGHRKMLENAMKERLTASACKLNADVESTTTTYNVNYILISFELFQMTVVLCLQIFFLHKL